MGKHREKRQCPVCNGKGTVPQWADGKKKDVTCTTCHGEGSI